MKLTVLTWCVAIHLPLPSKKGRKGAKLATSTRDLLQTGIERCKEQVEHGNRQGEPVGSHEWLHTGAHMDDPKFGGNMGSGPLSQELPRDFRGIPDWEERMAAAGRELGQRVVVVHWVLVAGERQDGRARMGVWVALRRIRSRNRHRNRCHCRRGSSRIRSRNRPRTRWNHGRTKKHRMGRQRGRWVGCKL